MNFFAGSGSALATAMKMSRKSIAAEQIDEQIIKISKWLSNVTYGDQTGVPKEVNWQGSSSFVYTELVKRNQGLLYDLQEAATIDELNTVYDQVKQGADLDFRVDLNKFESGSERTSLPFGDQKKLSIKLLDKNQLYYNEANIDDVDVRDLISDSDYRLNKDFYNGEELK